MQRTECLYFVFVVKQHGDIITASPVGYHPDRDVLQRFEDA